MYEQFNAILCMCMECELEPVCFFYAAVSYENIKRDASDVEWQRPKCRPLAQNDSRSTFLSLALSRASRGTDRHHVHAQHAIPEGPTSMHSGQREVDRTCEHVGE